MFGIWVACLLFSIGLARVWAWFLHGIWLITVCLLLDV